MKYLAKTLIALLAVLVFATAAQAETRTLRYANVRNWDVSAVYEGSQFVFCTAGVPYRDKTYFMINLSRTEDWSLSLFNDGWHGSPNQSFAVELYIDGALVDRNQATWLPSGRGAVINFGKSVSSIRALMRGRALEIVSRDGTSTFRLNGSYAASLKVAECFDSQYQNQVAGSGAFGGSSNGAFAVGKSDASNLVPRAETLEAATVYLGSSKMPYRILPADENEIDVLPVNWKFGENSIGGMAIFVNPGITGEEALTSFLKEQAGLCTGKSAVDRKPLQSAADGTKVSSAEGVCETNEGTVTSFYKVIQTRRLAIVIAEFASLADQESTREFNDDTEFSAGLLTSFPNR